MFYGYFPQKKELNPQYIFPLICHLCRIWQFFYEGFRKALMDWLPLRLYAGTVKAVVGMLVGCGSTATSPAHVVSHSV